MASTWRGDDDAIGARESIEPHRPQRPGPTNVPHLDTPQDGPRPADDSQPRGGPEPPGAAPEVMMRGDGIGEVRQREREGERDREAVTASPQVARGAPSVPPQVQMMMP